MASTPQRPKNSRRGGNSGRSRNTDFSRVSRRDDDFRSSRPISQAPKAPSRDEDDDVVAVMARYNDIELAA